MNKMIRLYWSIGGLLLITSTIAFLYFVLFNYKPSWSQWFADVVLGVVGALFMKLADINRSQSNE